MGSTGRFDGSSDDLYFAGIYMWSRFFHWAGSTWGPCRPKKSKIFLAGLFILYLKMSSWESIFEDEMTVFKFDHFSLLPLISWKDVTQPANQLCLQRGRSDSIFSFHCTLTAPQSVSSFIFLPEMQSGISVSLQGHLHQFGIPTCQAVPELFGS